MKKKCQHLESRRGELSWQLAKSIHIYMRQLAALLFHLGFSVCQRGHRRGDTATAWDASCWNENQITLKQSTRSAWCTPPYVE